MTGEDRLYTPGRQGWGARRAEKGGEGRVRRRDSRCTARRHQDSTRLGARSRSERLVRAVIIFLDFVVYASPVASGYTWPRKVIDSRRRRAVSTPCAREYLVWSFISPGPNVIRFRTHVRCLCKYPLLI